ncbi:MAG: hypothetical protein WCO94_05865 [Verrucomicrobiota bacterium]
MSNSRLPYSERVLRRLTPGDVVAAFGLGLFFGAGFVVFVLPMIIK